MRKRRLDASKDHSMSYLFALLIVLSVTAVAAAASFIAGRRVGLGTRRRYHDVGLPVFAQLGLLLSVLIAFVFSGVWGDYRTADEAMGGNEVRCTEQRSSLTPFRTIAEKRSCVRSRSMRTPWPRTSGAK
jgi:hypothetical protein